MQRKDLFNFHSKVSRVGEVLKYSLDIFDEFFRIKSVVLHELGFCGVFIEQEIVNELADLIELAQIA